MVIIWKIHFFLLYSLIDQSNIQYVTAAWPTLNISSIRLLGIFPYRTNASKTATLSIHSSAMFKAAILLSQQYNITIDGHFIEWQIIHTDGNMINSLSSTCRSISSRSNIIGVVGPGFSTEGGTTVTIKGMNFGLISDVSTIVAKYQNKNFSKAYHGCYEKS